MVTLLSPFTPMIFMGEEWGAATPWRFFTSHPEPELAELVRTGRLEEFAEMDWDTRTSPTRRTRTPSSKLDWSELDGPHGELLALTTRLIEIRRTYPDFTDPRFDHGRAPSDDEEGWLLSSGATLIMAVNFRDHRPRSWSDATSYRCSRSATPR